MNEDLKRLLDTVKPMFLKKANLLKWEACQWLQYTGWTKNERRDTYVLRFKTSTYGITFHVEVYAFTSLYGDLSHLFKIHFNEIYAYFKSVKYEEVTK